MPFKFLTFKIIEKNYKDLKEKSLKDHTGRLKQLELIDYAIEFLHSKHIVLSEEGKGKELSGAILYLADDINITYKKGILGRIPYFNNPKNSVFYKGHEACIGINQRNPMDEKTKKEAIGAFFQGILSKELIKKFDLSTLKPTQTKINDRWKYYNIKPTEELFDDEASKQRYKDYMTSREAYDYFVYTVREQIEKFNPKTLNPVATITNSGNYPLNEGEARTQTALFFKDHVKAKIESFDRANLKKKNPEAVSAEPRFKR